MSASIIFRTGAAACAVKALPAVATAALLRRARTSAGMEDADGKRHPKTITVQRDPSYLGPNRKATGTNDDTTRDTHRHTPRTQANSRHRQEQHTGQSNGHDDEARHQGTRPPRHGHGTAKDQAPRPNTANENTNRQQEKAKQTEGTHTHTHTAQGSQGRERSLMLERPPPTWLAVRKA